jgi:riboflavin kinase/FMN adenylyltransferase
VTDIWRSLAEVPTDLGRTVVTVGNFDGVHLGHQHVVARAREIAAGLGVARVVAVTFDPHPMAVLRPEHAPPTLTTVETRVRLLREAGVDDVLVLPFSREIAAWSPERFVEEVLVEALHARAVVVGANFRFGSKAAGDVTLLRELGERHDFVAEGIALDGGPQVWSSTYVRNCLDAGDVEGAAEALGRPFTVRGVVVKGDQRGRELGYPTANVPAVGLHAPADGVYAGHLTVLEDGRPLPAAISVGTNPTFAGRRERRVESYVLGRDDLELYGVEVEVSFVARIRGMKRFDSVEDLVATMDEDCERARLLLDRDAVT